MAQVKLTNSLDLKLKNTSESKKKFYKTKLTSQTNSLPFLVTAAFCVRPVATWITWVSLLGKGSLIGSVIPLPQQNTEVKVWGFSGRLSENRYEWK